MADTTARALQLLELLQSAQQRSVAELADRLGVDERTIRRDMARLLELGLPVQTLRGRYGGYRIAQGRRVLPLMFGAEEAVAVYLGLARVQAAAREPAIAAQTALSKIKRALPAAEAERVDALLQVMTRTAGHEDAMPEPGVMLTLADAIALGRALELRYVDSGGTPSRRTVHPFSLVAHGGRWYLIALETERQQERAFRADRVRSARALGERFTPERVPDPEGRLLDLFATVPYRWHVVLRLHASEEHIRAHLPRSMARLEREHPGGDGEGGGERPWYRADIRAERLDWLPSVIAALGCEVRIVGPDELRLEVRAAAERMVRAAR